MYSLYAQLTSGRVTCFISLDEGKYSPKDYIFNFSMRDATRAAGASRPINSKDVNRFLNFVGLALKKHSDEVKKDLCGNFIYQMLAACEEEGIDYNVPEVVNHFLNKWI